MKSQLTFTSKKTLFLCENSGNLWQVKKRSTKHSAIWQRKLTMSSGSNVRKLNVWGDLWMWLESSTKTSKLPFGIGQSLPVMTLGGKTFCSSLVVQISTSTKVETFNAFYVIFVLKKNKCFFVFVFCQLAQCYNKPFSIWFTLRAGEQVLWLGFWLSCSDPANTGFVTPGDDTAKL